MNVDMAAYLSARIAASRDFEACLAEPELSVVCFRHLPDGRDGADEAGRIAVDVHQDRLQAALEASGQGFLTTTRLRGRTWLRAGILNYMTRPADIDRLLDELRRLAASSDGLAADQGRGAVRLHQVDLAIAHREQALGGVLPEGRDVDAGSTLRSRTPPAWSRTN